MKKLVGLFLLLSLFLTSCNFTSNTNGYLEIWSSFDEFDKVGFNFEEYLIKSQNDDTVQIELLEEKENVQEYKATYSNQSVLFFKVCNDVETAKSIHQKNADVFIGVRTINPFLTSVRIDNIVVIPNDDLISNERMIHFAERIGIESNQIMLNKINKSSRIVRKDTEKTFESILQCMEERGYSLIEGISIIGEDHQICTFVSNDNSTVYEIFMISGDQARNNLYYRIKAGIIDFPHDHVHVYYSIGNDYCMYFMGTSAYARDLWNEIR